MDATNTAAVQPRAEVAGMALAGAIAAGISLAILPVTLVVVAVVRIQEAAPQLVQAFARRLPKRGPR